MSNLLLGNFVAVGSFEPGIEMYAYVSVTPPPPLSFALSYNLDIIDTLEPTVVLGGRVADSEMSAKKKKKKKTLFVRHFPVYRSTLPASNSICAARPR
jgi:hypothetical protein